MPTYFRHGHWIIDDQPRTDPAPAGAAAPAAAGEAQFVITLTVTPQPLPLPPASALPQIGGLSVFRARHPIANREVHLLQLGYFASFDAARAFLPHVETQYPGAFVERARTGTMTSLDDTSIAAFEVLRLPASAAGSPTSAGPQPAADPASPGPQPVPAVQRYALQLVRQPTPIDLSRIARPSVFHGYTLYRVQSERDGYRSYGLRLGFFTDAHSARLVAEYVKSQFPRCAAVPVSEREYARVRSEPRR